jgi:pimeloyl-ACP methyl ester carboxylesterase
VFPSLSLFISYLSAFWHALWSPLFFFFVCLLACSSVSFVFLSCLNRLLSAIGIVQQNCLSFGSSKIGVTLWWLEIRYASMQQTDANRRDLTRNGNFEIYTIGFAQRLQVFAVIRNMLSLRRVVTTTVPSVGGQGLLAVPASTRLYSQSVGPLVYDLHEPAQPKTDKKKSPILFLHGLFGSKKNNRAISKALARDLGRYVYALDLRNHGESPHDTRHDYSAMAQDVAEFIEGHGLKDTTLIGHSMGAKTSMALALRSPDLVSDIVAVDNAPVDVSLSRDFPKYVRAMKKIQEAGVTRQSEADKILSEYEESLPIRQFLLGNMYLPEGEKVRKFRIPLHTLGKALDNLGDFPYKNPNEIRFEKPALFVRGTQSKYVPDDVLPLIGQFFPKFRLVDVDAGHWLISEQPEAFRQAVVEFLQKPE